MASDRKLILTALKRCKTIRKLHQVHARAITSGIVSRYPAILLPNILYTITRLTAPTCSTTSSPRGHLSDYAVSVFNGIENPTTFCYNMMMRAHILLSSPSSAILTFVRMRRLSISPDFHTFPFALKASGHLSMPSLATSLHSQALKFGLIFDLFVLNSIVHVYSISNLLTNACALFEESIHKDVVSYNSLIDGFVKAGDTHQAHALFDKMCVRDAVSWGTLVAGYAQTNQCREAIDLLNCMIHSSSGVFPDNIALVSALSACSQLGDLEQGIEIHNFIICSEIRVDAFLATGLVDLYAKCGCIETAIEMFKSSTNKNLFTWNAVLVGLAIHGQGKICLDYFSRMIKDGIQPDGVSFLGVLVGCSHAGLISDARQLFKDMEAVYGVPRELKHYGCMADLLGRAGLIREALELIESMPLGGDIYVWGGLLAGCRAHGLVEIAKKASEHVQRLNPEDGGAYSMMVNVYANAELWDDVVKTRSLMKTRKVRKKAGCSLIKLYGIAHEFVAGDHLHPQIDEIYMVLSSFGKHQFEASV